MLDAQDRGKVPAEEVSVPGSAGEAAQRVLEIAGKVEFGGVGTQARWRTFSEKSVTERRGRYFL